MQSIVSPMSVEKIFLASDNYSPAHPKILQAILEANHGFCCSYGHDPWTERAEALISQVFDKDCKTLMVPTGTGSNVLALKIACQRHESVLCTDIAHINYQESGAAESLAGCKLLGVPHKKGKITEEAVFKKLRSERAFGKHSTSPKILSITQPTEVGTVYTLSELQSLSAICKEEKLLLHMDGSRLYNAAAYLNCSLKEITEGVDLLSLGGTKNGLMGAEALLIFNPLLNDSSEYLQKQNLLLLSKMRYLSAQYIPFFEKNFWHTLAIHANETAQEIASIIKAIPQLTLNYPVQTNQIFFTAPFEWLPLIQEKIACYLWNEEKDELRFISSWCTSKQDVERVRTLLSSL